MQQSLTSNSSPSAKPSATFSQETREASDLIFAAVCWSSAAMFGQMLANATHISSRVDPSMHAAFATCGLLLCATSIPTILILRNHCPRSLALALSALLVMACVIIANMT